ncbi:MAG: tetratricopeptide repeat protein, partial [Pedobacter sp.]
RYDNYHEAESVLSIIFRFLNSAKQEELDDIRLYSLILYTEILQAFDKNAEAEPVFYEIKQLSEKLRIPFDSYKYANYLSKIGRFAEAEPILYNYFQDQNNITSQDQRTKERGLNVAFASHNLAVHFRMQGRYDEAIRFHHTAVSLYREYTEQDHTYVTIVEMSFAGTLIEEGRDLELAVDILNTIYDRMDVVEFSSYHKSLLSIMIARLMIAQKDLTQAIKFIEMGSEVVTNVKTEQSTSVITITSAATATDWTTVTISSAPQRRARAVAPTFRSAAAPEAPVQTLAPDQGDQSLEFEVNAHEGTTCTKEHHILRKRQQQQTTVTQTGSTATSWAYVTVVASTTLRGTVTTDMCAEALIQLQQGRQTPTTYLAYHVPSETDLSQFKNICLSFRNNILSLL